MKPCRRSWTLTDGDETHRVLFECAGVTKKITVTIDGDAFVLKTGLLRSPARREPFRVGDEAYMLVVDKKGRADIYLAGEKIECD